MKSHRQLKTVVSYIWTILSILTGIFFGLTIQNTIWYWWVSAFLLYLFMVIASWTHGSLTATIILEEEEVDGQ